jgi:hypothetical protein
MSENEPKLGVLIIRAIDDLAKVTRSQRLLRIALDELGQPSGDDTETIERVDLLIDSYFCQSEAFLEDLQFDLDKILKMAAASKGQDL